jgi:GNAT superfamily N-acetyltransferase
MTVTVRRLTEDDWKTLREIRLRALLDAPESFYSTYQESVGLTEDDWRSRLASTDRVTLLAELDERPAGMVSGAPTSEDERDPRAALMLAMWVEPESRGHGVANALTGALLDWSREQGYRRLRSGCTTRLRARPRSTAGPGSSRPVASRSFTTPVGR